MAVPLAAATAGCAVRPLAPPPREQTRSILVGSTPTAGSAVRAPIDALRLRFNPPARLDELTVSGPDGVMPTMVHAIGQVADYSIPLPDLRPGAYTVAWRANVRGTEYRGSFDFRVK